MGGAGWSPRLANTMLQNASKSYADEWPCNIKPTGDAVRRESISYSQGELTEGLTSSNQGPLSPVGDPASIVQCAQKLRLSAHEQRKNRKSIRRFTGLETMNLALTYS